MTSDPVPLPEILMHHTWSIRVIGPIDISLRQQDKEYQKLEKEMAEFLESRRGNNDEEEKFLDSRLSVHLSWGICKYGDQSTYSISAGQSSNERATKRRRLETNGKGK